MGGRTDEGGGGGGVLVETAAVNADDDPGGGEKFVGGLEGLDIFVPGARGLAACIGAGRAEG